jgi:hypothetical protein
MTHEQLRDYLLSDKDEVELTDELIENLVKEKKWSTVESLKEMAEMGAKWNTARNTIVFPTEFF